VNTIFLSDRKIIFTLPDHPLSADLTLMAAPGLDISFWKCFEQFRHMPGAKTMSCLSNDPARFFDQVAGFFEPLEAAGGLVRNLSGQLLFIHRYGKWDLPKGHLEPGELPALAASREISEETGVINLNLIELLDSTFHLYQGQDKRWYLKKTWWYFFETQTNSELSAQINEGIVLAVWLQRRDLTKVFSNTYGSIIKVLETAIRKRLL